MRIAICDDSKDEISKIRWAMFDIKADYQIDAFQSGKELFESVKGGAVYDVLFCDIYMNGENGIDVAKEMQKLSPGTAIVFTTTSTEHAVEAFSLRALHYIVKPVKAEDVVEVLSRIGKKEEPRHTLAVRVSRTLNMLYQDEIVRIEGADHRTVITMLDGNEYSIWKPCREVCDMLDGSFIQIKKGVMVNMRHIKQMTARECVLKDGNAFLLRRDQAKELRERYYSFVENELNNK